MTDYSVFADAEAFRVRIRSMFGGLRHWLAGVIARPGSFHPVAGLEMFLNPVRLSHHFKAPEQGAADGRNNLPPVDAEDLTTFEVAVRMKCNDALLRLKRQTDAALIGYEAKLFAIDIKPVGTAIARIESEAERRFQTLHQTKRAELIELRKAGLLAERDLRQFTVDNQLRRGPKPLRPVGLTPGLIVGMILLEGAANAAIFAKVTDYGWFGGYAFAGLIAACNVLFAFFIGMFLVRNLTHRYYYRRLMGGVGSVVFVLLLLFLQFNLAKFRTLIETNPGFLTIPSLLDSQVEWSLPAGALFVISVGFAAIALVDGFCISGDPYPGYSAMARHRLNGVLAYRRALIGFKSRSVLLIGDAQREVKSLVDGEAKALFSYQSLTADFRSIVTLYEQNAHQIENACNHVIKEYRDKNVYVRTQAAPAYFTETIALDWAIGREIGDPGARLEQFTDTIDDMGVEAEDAKTRLHNLLVRQLQEIEDDLAAIDNAAALIADRESAVFKQAGGMEI